MPYNKIPDEVKYCDVISNKYSLSPIMYKNIHITSKKAVKISELLMIGKPYDKGIEPGSQWYIKKSDKYLIRTKAVQEHSYLLYPKGDCIVPINPKKYCNMKIKQGDILLSKDSNIGEVAIIAKDECNNSMISGGLVKLNLKPEIDNFYVFAFLKHQIFKEQLEALCPKGATIKHAGERWMDCLIPFPSQDNKTEVVQYVSKLVQLIINKEYEITHKAQLIIDKIDSTLKNNQKSNTYIYQYPSIKEIEKEKRLDAAIYCKEYASKINLVENFSGGFMTPTEYGFKVIPGPSLEIKLLKTRIDSDSYIEGFYKLIIPTNISEYGTINKITYLGTKRNLPLLKKGDILFGEAGFQKGRSVVLTDDIDAITTNAHGLYARADKVDLKKSIYFRCIFDWYRKMRLVDLMAVGGSGGHFSPEYFDYIRIPKFDGTTIDCIVDLYYKPSNEKMDFKEKKEKLFKRDNELGIVQLSQEIEELKKELNIVLDKIVSDEVVKC